MILLPTNKMYYNTRTWFVNNVLTLYDVRNNLPFYKIYRDWLAEQGATLKEFKFSDNLRVVDTFGVAPMYDQFQFDCEEDATIFVLRWS